MSSTLLRAENLRCERDDRLLFSDLSFEINSGDVLQLEGPNGAGKTTLLRILSGLFPSYDGKVYWREQNVQDCQAEFKSDLLFLGHKSAVKATLSPLENLRFLVAMHQPVTDNELHQALERVGLSGYEYVPCRNLSAGQHRRVALARLYLSKAKFWVLDEIFTAIDKAGVAQFEALLAEKAKAGMAIVLTTHHHLAMECVRKLQLGRIAHVRT